MKLNISKLNVKIFVIVLLLMPICSVYILPHIFKGWHLNLAMTPLVISMLLTTIDKKSISYYVYRDNNIMNILKWVNIIFIYTMFNSLLMYYIFMLNTDIPNKLTNRYIYITIFEIIIPFSITLYSVVYSSKLGYKKTIKIILISMTIIIAYGYIQFLATRTNNDIAYKIYEFISSKIDYIWGNENNYQYAMVSKRLNLTTPEAAEAGGIIGIIYYTFLVPLIINNTTVFNNRLFGLVKIESIMFIISIPILLLSMSTTNYFIFLIVMFVLFFSLLKKRKSIFKKYIIIIVFLVLAILTLFVILNLKGDFAENFNYYISKIGDLSNKSTSTRLGLMYANLTIFFKYMFNGVGFTNLGLLIPKNLPSWAFNEEINQYIYIDDKWLSGARNFRVLSCNGIIGIVLILILVYWILKYLKKNNNIMYQSFKFFILISFIQGFTSGEFKFIYIWVMCGIFISAASENNMRREVE